MKLYAVSINQSFSDMDERKQFYFNESDKIAFSHQLLGENVSAVVILSTCNRSEVYIMDDHTFDGQALASAFLHYFHQEGHSLEIYSDKQAIQHLLEVACGLKSMVIGEDQILHQMKEAFNWTMEQHFSCKEMNFLFQNVIRFARQMRSEYAISEHPLSVSYIGYQCIKEYLKPDSKIMICGIGEMSQLMIDYLKDETLYLVNRTYDKVAPYLQGKRTYVPFEKRYEWLEEIDIVVTATASPHTIFQSQKIATTKPLIFLDLAMPRDVDSQLRERDKTIVIDLDDLQRISAQELQKRQSICLTIQERCVAETENIAKGLSVMKSDSTIQALQNRYLHISDETYQILRKKINLTPKEDYILQKVLRASFLRLLKEPVALLKSHDDMQQQQYIELIHHLMNGREEKS